MASSSLDIVEQLGLDFLTIVLDMYVRGIPARSDIRVIDKPFDLTMSFKTMYASIICPFLRMGIL